MFVAKHHVTLGGRHYLPGEVIDQQVPEETAEWWLSVGAAEYVNINPVSGLDPNAFKHHPATKEPEEEPEPEGEEVPEDEPEQEDEIDEAAEPEEIDVSAGIVPPSQESEPTKPERTSRKRGGNKS